MVSLSLELNFHAEFADCFSLGSPIDPRQLRVPWHEAQLQEEFLMVEPNGLEFLERKLVNSTEFYFILHVIFHFLFPIKNKRQSISILCNKTP